MNEVWFRRPGIASNFTPSEGTAHECRTSSAVIKVRVVIPTGVVIRLSTSRRRNWPGRRSLEGIM